MRRTALTRPALIAVSVVLASGTLAACGASTDDASSTPTTTASVPIGADADADEADEADEKDKAKDTEDDTDVKVVEVTMTGSKVEPPPGRIVVDKGTEMKVVVTRDTDGEIHIHGVDQDVDAKAGEPVTMRFTAEQDGIFEAEAHDPDRQLFQLVVK